MKVQQIPGTIRLIAVVLGLGILTAVAQSYPSAYPRKNATEILHNDRLNVWDVYWPKGQPTPMHVHPFDQFSITLREGAKLATRPGGPRGTPHIAKVGSVAFTPKGTIHMEEGTSDIPTHKVMLEVKPHAAADDVQGTLPAEGAAKVFENGRLAAWDLTWTPQQTVSYDAENFATVTVFLHGGTIRSVTGPGKSAETVRTAGQVVYSPDGIKAHTEQAVSGSPRAVIVELK